MHLMKVDLEVDYLAIRMFESVMSLHIKRIL